jgi:hypothetical protein
VVVTHLQRPNEPSGLHSPAVLPTKHATLLQTGGLASTQFGRQPHWSGSPNALSLRQLPISPRLLLQNPSHPVEDEAAQGVHLVLSKSFGPPKYWQS